MIDLFSDTHTLPSEGMRTAMAGAEVGDEQKREDPTTRALEERVAALLGKEAALFLATGSMCNKVAVASFTRPGDAVVCDSQAHVLRFEGGGSAVISGVIFETLATERGHFTPEQLTEVMNPGDVYQPRTALVGLEQTHNLAGGTVWPLDIYESVCRVAKASGASAYTDGARLFNAVIASGVSADAWAAPVDAIWIDFAKGLGAPGGAAIAGSVDVIDTANRFKYLLGGAMRQSGILAAAALWGLDHNIERLAEDHQNASRLAEGLGALGLTVEPPDTNMVFCHPPEGLSLDAFVGRLEEEGVRAIALAGRVRLVTHLDITQDQIDEAIEAARRVVSG